MAWVFLGVERDTRLFVADQVRDEAVHGTDLFLRTARDAKRFRILKLDLRQPRLALGGIPGNLRSERRRAAPERPAFLRASATRRPTTPRHLCLGCRPG